MTEDGSCQDCSQYTHTNGDQKQCIAETCSGQYLDQQGFCQDCPENSVVEDTISCKCFDYFFMNDQGQCEKPECQDNEITLMEGTCEACQNSRAVVSTY